MSKISKSGFRVASSIACSLYSLLSYCTSYTVSNSAQITSIMTSAQPGDTLRMTPGVWNNQVINFGGADGTASAPIVLIADVMGQVFLEGSSRLKIYGNYLVVNGLTFRNPDALALATSHIIEFRSSSSGPFANHCRITNIHIINYNSQNSVDNKWVSLYGTYNKVDHCKFDGKSNYGPTVVVWYQAAGGFPNESLSTYHTIEYNYFINRTLPLGGNGGETIRVGDSQTSRTNGYNVIQYNLFEQCDGEIEIISNKSEYNYYRYNTFRESNGQLTLRHGAFCTVEGNFFLGKNYQGSSGIRLIDSAHVIFNNYFEELTGGEVGTLRAPITIMNGDNNPAANGYWPVKNCQIYNNSFINCLPPYVNIGVDSDVRPESCTFNNNLFYGPAGPFFEVTTNPVNFQYYNNIYYGASLGISNTGFVNVDPLLSNTGPSGLYRLTSSSPAIDGGTTVVISDDFEGQNRISVPDIGADEYSTTAEVRLPLNPEDVGPCWLTNDPLCQSIVLAIEDINSYHTIVNNKINVKVIGLKETEEYEIQKYNNNSDTWDILVNSNSDENGKLEFVDSYPIFGDNIYRILSSREKQPVHTTKVDFSSPQRLYKIVGNQIIFEPHQLNCINQVCIYDMIGSAVYKVKNLNQETFNINLETIPQVFIICIQLNNGNILSDKFAIVH